jgi:hypothetical protein
LPIAYCLLFTLSSPKIVIVGKIFQQKFARHIYLAGVMGCTAGRLGILYVSAELNQKERGKGETENQSQN